MKVILALVLTGLTLALSACATHESEVNDYSTYYAQKGERMTKPFKRPSDRAIEALIPQNTAPVR